MLSQLRNSRNSIMHSRGEPEFELHIRGRDHEYMIVKYDDHASFQRCGLDDGSGEMSYRNLEAVMSSDLVDGINLERDWSSVDTIVMNSALDLSLCSTAEEAIEEFGDLSGRHRFA